MVKGKQFQELALSRRDRILREGWSVHIKSNGHWQERAIMSLKFDSHPALYRATRDGVTVPLEDLLLPRFLPERKAK